MVIEDSIPVDFTLPLFSETMWFIFVFLLIYWIKHSEIAKGYLEKNKYQVWIVLLLGISFVIGLNILADIPSCCANVSAVISDFASRYSNRYDAMPGFLISLSAFLIFKDFKINSHRIVSIIAKATGGIYIIHAVPVLFRYKDYGFTIWNGVFEVDQHIADKTVALEMIVCTIMVVLIGSIAFYVCNYITDHFIMRTSILKKVENTLDSLFGQGGV